VTSGLHVGNLFPAINALINSHISASSGESVVTGCPSTSTNLYIYYILYPVSNLYVYTSFVCQS